jgi:outer membrane protein W
MTINLIDEPTYDRLIAIYNFYPNLTFQNEGYTYPDKSNWSAEDLAAHERVSEVLKKAIVGFSQFNHFKNVKGEPTIRLQYNWTADDDSNPRPFIGVGYLYIDTLFTGFKNKT